MAKRAVGLIEVLGYSVALDALDKALKSSDVEILGIDVNNPIKGEGAVIPNVFHVRIAGEVDHVRHALEVAKAQALKHLSEEDILVHLIPGISDGLDGILKSGKVKRRR